MARKFQFSLGGMRQRLFTRNDGTKHEDRVWLIEYLKRADIVIEVPDDDADFDSEKLRKNENEEWGDYDWILEDYLTKAVTESSHTFINKTLNPSTKQQND
jgi:hypothetical protein